MRSSSSCCTRTTDVTAAMPSAASPHPWATHCRCASRMTSTAHPRAATGAAAGGSRASRTSKISRDVVGAREQHPEAAVAADRDEPGLGQPQEALAHGAAGDAEQVGQLVHRVGLLRHQLARGHAVAHRGHHGVGQ